MYAIADGIHAMNFPRDGIRVISVGVGAYPPKRPTFMDRFYKKYICSVALLQMSFEINIQSREEFRSIIFKDVQTIRISDTFERPEMATDFMEYDLAKLRVLRLSGSDSYGKLEDEIKACSEQ